MYSSLQCLLQHSVPSRKFAVGDASARWRAASAGASGRASRRLARDGQGPRGRRVGGLQVAAANVACRLRLRLHLHLRLHSTLARSLDIWETRAHAAGKQGTALSPSRPLPSHTSHLAHPQPRLVTLLLSIPATRHSSHCRGSAAPCICFCACFSAATGQRSLHDIASIYARASQSPFPTLQDDIACCAFCEGMRHHEETSCAP